MPYASNAELPAAVRTALPAAGQSTWRTIFNAADKQYPDDEEKAFATAWAGLRRAGWTKQGDTWHKVEKVVKVDSERQHVFGWASVAIAKDGGQVEDLQGDLIDVEELEQAAYDFMLEFRDTGAMHKGEAIGKMIESFVITPDKLEAMGLASDALPQGWWVGFHVNDTQAFDKIKKGEYQGFSIQGSAVREEV
jgi:cation transport regulator ChaB